MKLKHLWMSLALVSLVGCASGPKKPTGIVGPPNAKGLAEYTEAEKLYVSKKNIPALKKFQTFVSKNPNTNLTDDAYYYMGLITYEAGEYLKASRYFMAVVDGKSDSNVYYQSLQKAAETQAQMGFLDNALSLIDRAKNESGINPDLKASMLAISAKVHLQKGAPLYAIRDYYACTELPISQEASNLYLSKALEIVTSYLNEKQLDELVSGIGSYPNLEGSARYRLAIILFDQKNWPPAKREFEKVYDKFAKSPLGEKAKQYLDVINSQQSTDPTTIGAVLPLTGKGGERGYRVLRGLQMGLGIFNKGSPFKLAVVDSENNPDLARRGVDRLVGEDHVVAIVGDLGSRTAQSVAKKANEFGVPCITLSQKSGLTEVGDFIFNGTVTVEAQMKRLVEIAMDQYGYERFAILFPNDSYGTEYATAFWDNVLLKGGSIVAAQPYNPTDNDFRYPVQRLVGTYWATEDRAKELALRTTLWKKENKSARDKLPQDLMPPITDFDAIFIPDNPKAVGQIAAMLAFNDVPQKPLLGTNLWNSPQIVTRGEKFVEKSIFIDSFFTESTSPQQKSFVSKFENLYGYKPDVLEVQGYDAGILLAETIRSSNYSLARSELRDHLSKSRVVTGSSDVVAMNSLRELQKKLVPLTVTKGQIVELKSNGSK